LFYKHKRQAIWLVDDLMSTSVECVHVCAYI